MKFRKLMVIGIVTLLFTSLVLYTRAWEPQAEPTFSGATLRVGSTGSDVSELQGRLKFLGYYNGDIDGVFGSRTKNAVTWFQWEFGLTSDGVVGSATKNKLVNATKNWNPSMHVDSGSGGSGSSGNTGGSGGGSGGSASQSNLRGFTENDIQLMANAVYGEARGEPYEGQVAVAAVILNRVKHPDFPDTVYGVIFQPRAFTAVDDGQIYLSPNETAKRAVRDAINGWDPTYGCIYYFNPNTATSAWIWTRQQILTIGKHIFCK
ncbi:spore cortex-lytic enzyme [Paenibacillus montaniterrae]|uniref:Spore cortex-lytic enzyme n=1 Tax=Paenibacillus montaniterrae TaxID=429341 RepID=A0A920CVX5_9BACL|nr:spore cortex-lytic enzyme [Paenibacillus montaniterrae]GIP14615.1 spore cortex-lytic enzyme [Paenibacillus montaniterrae]